MPRLNDFISVILLAAGESTRMGLPKQTLLWEDRTLLEYQISQVAATSANELIVVLGFDAKEYQKFIPELRNGPVLKLVENKKYDQGKSTSVKEGIFHIDQRSQGVMILAVDSPRSATILQKLMEVHTKCANLITYPSYQGKRGHPPLIARSLYPEIETISEEKQGLREIADKDPSRTKYVGFDTPLVLVNINSVDDYQEALSQLEIEKNRSIASD